ncbi:PKD domain-containing protein [bacterium]|nr:PKD domain-containing protein [bacterium]
MKLLRCVTLLLSLCIVLQVSACGGGQRSDVKPQAESKALPAGSTAPDAAPESTQPRAAPAQLQAGLPPLDSLRGASTALENNYLNPSQYSTISSSGASTNGLDLLLDSAPGELAFGTYVLDITPQITQRWLDLLLTYPDATPDDEPVWVALADFSAGRWELHDVRSEGSSFELSDPRYLSSAQTISLALLAWDGGTVTCEGIYLTAAGGNSAPLADLQADVTSGAAPLSVNFDASGSSDVDGNITSYRWDFDGDGIADDFTQLPQASHSYNGGGTFEASVTVQDVYSEQATAQLTVTVNGGNQSPQASFLVLPDTVDTIEAVVLDGSASSDPDGSIVKYEWDTDGDGIFDPAFDFQEITDGFTFLTGGVRTLTLRVTDDDGATDTAIAPVTVHGWSGLLTIPVPGTPSGGVYEDCSLAQISGRPAFSCMNTNGALYYVRAEDAVGSSWGAAQRISNANNVAGESSLCFVNGRPAVAFWNQASEKLRYVQATDAVGSDWPDPVTVADGVTAYSLKLMEFQGKPAIGYNESSSQFQEIFFQRAADADGTAWLSPLFVANCGITPICMMLVSSRPAFCSFGDAGTYSNGFYKRSGDDDGAQWNADPEQINSVEGDSFIFGGSMIETGSGRPAFSGLAVSEDLGTVLGIRYCLADTNGQNWSNEETFAAGDHPTYCCLARVDGRPALIYSADPDGDFVDSLFYCESLNDNGTNWAAPQEVVQMPSDLDLVNELDLIDVAGSPGALVKSNREYYFIYETP